MADDLDRIRGYVREERRAALLYRRLAETVDGRERRVLLRLAEGEESHADHWERVLGEAGTSSGIDGIRLRLLGRIALSLGRRFGLLGAMPVLERHEGREAEEYAAAPEAPASLVAEERDHTAMVRSLVPSWRAEVAGTLRAGIFGVSDGIVSNLALVIGVVGAGAASSTVVTAGVAGLVAGALSMAVGEYVSVASQREVLIAGDHEHDAAADPWRAAVASFVTFAGGAAVPVVPFLLGSGLAAAVTALLATGLLLYGVGAALSLLTMRSAVRSGLRQLGLGWAAAGATYLVGLAIGGGTPA